MSLFYYINLIKHIFFDSPRLLKCLVIWNGGSRSKNHSEYRMCMWDVLTFRAHEILKGGR